MALSPYGAPMMFDLPQGANINLLTQPLQQGLQAYRQGMDKKFEGERELKQEQQADERLNIAKQQAADARQERMMKSFGNMVMAVVNEPDEAKAQSYWQRIKAIPEFAKEAAAAGLDLNDHRGTARIVAARAGVLPDPLEQEKTRAAIAASNASTAAQTQSTRNEAELFPYKRDVTKLQYESAKRDYENPVQFVDLGPDHARVGFNKQTGQEVTRIQGPAKGPDSTTRKAIYEAQDELPNLRAAVDQLNEAKQLLPKIYTGIGSGARTGWNQAAPEFLPNILTDPNRAKDTQRYNQIMGAEGIGAMSQTLKGATTDFEMRQFMQLMNDPNQKPETKVKALDYMIRKAQAHYQNRVDRIKELGGRMPNDGTGVPGAAPTGAADPLGIR